MAICVPLATAVCNSCDTDQRDTSGSMTEYDWEDYIDVSDNITFPTYIQLSVKWSIFPTQLLTLNTMHIPLHYEHLNIKDLFLYHQDFSTSQISLYTWLYILSYRLLIYP